MTNANLRLLNGQTQDSTLREEVDAVLERHRADLVERLKLWVRYGAEVGARRLFLDDCPGLESDDYDYAVEWLREQGLSVVKPWWGRTRVVLS